MADGASPAEISNTLKATRLLRRLHRERHAAYRAIAPSWPVAIVGLLAIALFAGMDQTRDALMFTASGPIFSSALSFAIVLGLFTLALMQAGLQLMSVKRRNLYATKDEAAEPAHPSIGLRIGTAFILGILPALVLISLLLVNLGDPDHGDLIVGVVVLSIAGAIIAASWLSPLAQRVFDDKRLQRAFAEQKHKHADGGSLPWLRFRLRVNKLRWFAKPAPLAILLVTIVLLGVATETLRDDPRNAVVMAILSVGLCCLIYVRAYDKWMRVVGSRDRKQLVVDARMQAMLRGWTFIWIVACVGAFWAGYFMPIVFNALGPATALLMGLFLVLSVLGWFVRTALTPAERAVELYKGAWWEEPVVKAGVLSWWIQQHLSAHRVFGFGVALLTLDTTLSLMEWRWWKQPDGDMAMPDAAITLAVLLACFTGLFAFWFAGWIGRASALPRSKFRLRPEADDVPRIGTLILLLPFLMATLGEDRRPPYVFLDTQPVATERPLLAKAAEDWLAPRLNDPEITAVVVLAEGGGIRSAVHITQLLSEIDQQRPTNPILKDAYALAGVSGGAVGVSTFLAANAENSDPTARAKLMDGVLGADHMTPLIAGMFGSDFFSMFAPIDLPARIQRMRSPRKYMERAPDAVLPGRAEFFESSLGNAWMRAASAQSPNAANWLAAPMSRVIAKASGQRPAPVVMYPTFGVETGMRGLTSNVMFDNCSRASGGRFVDVMSCLGLQKDGGTRASSMDMPIRAAAHLSARFPGSNPPAVFDGCELNADPNAPCRLRRLRFVDGGYFDNSGASAAREAVDALVREARDKGALDRLRIVVVHAFFRDQRKPAAAWQPASAFNELAAPFDGVWSARSGSGQFPITSFCRDLISVSQTDDATNACGRIAADRSWISETTPPATECVPRLPGQAGPAIDWISAPVNNRRNANDDAHFLLGWSLQEKSRASMRVATEAMASKISGFMSLPESDCGLRVFHAG